MEKLVCKKCGSSHIVKCGVRYSIQRYQCCACKTKMQFTYCRKKHNHKKEQALELYLEGLGLRSIGRYLKVSHVSVLNWLIKQDVKTWLRPSKVKAIEIDEVYFFVGNKKEATLVMACCMQRK